MNGVYMGASVAACLFYEGRGGSAFLVVLLSRMMRDETASVVMRQLCAVHTDQTILVF